MSVGLHFSARSITRTLAGIAVVLALASLGLGLLHLWTQDSIAFLPDLRRVFDLDREASIPAWYTTMLLFMAAALLALVAVIREQAKDRFAGHWATLAVIFMLISLDEASAFHEHFSPAIANLFTVPVGFPIWVVAGIALIVVLLVYFARFLLALPAQTRRLFLAAGAIYVGGAMIVESIQGVLYTTGGYYGLRYVGLITLEETLEMLGVIMFIYGLLLHLSTIQEQVLCHFEE